MKLKFVLVPLVVLGFAVGSYADCSKDEIMKLIDKGYSKAEINGICGKSEPKKKKSKWISPSKKRTVTWSKAKKICSNLEGRLPTIDELKKVVIDCGGEMKDNNSAEWKRNKNNSSYQSCYKKKGFSSSNYWSSTRVSVVGFENSAWFVLFANGGLDGYSKDSDGYVRCMRAGQ